MTDVDGQRGGVEPSTNAAWAPVEGGSPRTPVAAASVPDAVLGGPARPVAAPPPAPVALRPAGSGAIFDGAFEVMKVRPRVLLGAAALIVVPVQIVAGVLRGGPVHFDLLTAGIAIVGDDDGAADALWEGTSSGALLGGLLEMAATFLVGVVLARTVAAWYAGADPAPLAALRDGVRRPGVLIGAFAAMAVAQAVGALVMCVGALVPVTWFCALAPVLGVERLGARAGVTRSFRLVNRRFMGVAGVVVGMSLVDQLLRFSLVAMPWLLADGLPEVAATGVRYAATTLAAVISSVFVAASCALVYFDLRVRSEGLDIELEATDAFASPG